MKSKNSESEIRMIGAKVMAASLLIATTFGVAADSQNMTQAATIKSATLVKKATLIASAPTKNSAVHLISSAKAPVNEPASAGIKLLQYILDHIKSMPVIALKNARKDMVNQQVAPQIAMNTGPAQQQLMIMPPSYTQGYAGTNETNSSKLARGSSLQVVDERPIVRDYREAPVLGMRAKRRAAMTASTAAPAEKAQDAQEPSGFQQLAANLNRFGGAIQNMQRLQQSVAAPQIANATADDKTIAPPAQGSRNLEISTNSQQSKSGVTESGAGMAGRGSSPGANAYNNSYPYGRAMQAPALTASMPPSSVDSFTRQAAGSSDQIYGDEGVASTSAATPPPLPSSPVAGGVMVPKDPEKYKYLRQSNYSNKQDADGVYAQKTAARGAMLAKKQMAERSKVSDLDRREIALLPPNVITGIPLVSLGTSAEQAQRLLAPRGKLTKQTIGKWSVWTLNRAGTNEPSMYLYMRHGMIEALRVLDSSFVTPSFGVELGAPLSAVKSKFGEPAFIISEPCNDPVNGGQNYVYPISQVAFQVARRAPKNEPVLVSILIFNVKDQ